MYTEHAKVVSSPDHSQLFNVAHATLKSWEWSGDEATCKDLHVLMQIIIGMQGCSTDESKSQLLHYCREPHHVCFHIYPRDAEHR